MKIFSVLLATLFVGGSLVLAQTCPPQYGSTCLVPNPNSVSSTGVTTYTLPASTSTSVVVPYSGVAMTTPMYGTGVYGTAPMYSVVPSTGIYGTAPMYAIVPSTGIYGATPMYGAVPSTGVYGTAPTYGTAAVSPDTTLILNQISALRGDVRGVQGQIRAAAIEMQGQQLVSRVNQLMVDEMLFRQQIAANPNLPNAQATATSLSARADALNRDLAGFNRELSLIPADQRPYIAANLNAFTVSYWDPTMQRFADYRTQFAQTGTTYQPAYAANPWLQTWRTGYESSLSNIASAPQTYASASWWSDTRVLGSMESYPGGGMVMLPPGAVVYIPSSTMTTTTTTTTMGTPANTTTMTPGGITPNPEGTTNTY